MYIFTTICVIIIIFITIKTKALFNKTSDYFDLPVFHVFNNYDANGKVNGIVRIHTYKKYL